MDIKLDYGEGKLEVSIDDNNLLEVLENEPIKPLSNIKNRLLEGYRSPIGSSTLADLISGKKKICIVIYGIDKDLITILVATGLHRPNTTEELIKMIGKEVVDNYRIVNHDARNRESCDYIGKTGRGTPVIIDKIYVESDFKILTGLIEPHFMAGFSGGRKAICPGISYMDMFKHFHGPAILESPKSISRRVPGNCKNGWSGFNC